MKNLLHLLVFVTGIAQSLIAQTTTITLNGGTSQNVTIQSGEVLQVLSQSVGGGPSYTGYITFDGNSISGATATDLVVAGPKTVTFGSTAGNKSYFTYKVSADNPIATTNVASQAVVIPSTGIANADVIFETSTDLVTWTAAVAGNYPPTTPSRFFRVRIVNH